MLKSNLKVVGSDITTLIKDAQTLLQSAATLSGEKADKLRQRGMQLLDDAAGKAKETQATALVAGKQIAFSANAYVKEHTWVAIGAAAGAGFLASLIARRK